MWCKLKNWSWLNPNFQYNKEYDEKDIFVC